MLPIVDVFSTQFVQSYVKTWSNHSPKIQPCDDWNKQNFIFENLLNEDVTTLLENFSKWWSQFWANGRFEKTRFSFVETGEKKSGKGKIGKREKSDLIKKKIEYENAFLVLKVNAADVIYKSVPLQTK